MAIEANLTVDSHLFLGEDKALVITIYQADGTTAQNITGWALSWLLKRRATDTDAQAKVTKTVGSGIALTTALSGVCTVSIADTDTASLESGVYRHELKRTDNGFETVLTFGTLELIRGVHR